jgi:hypothetical protein
MCNIDQPADFAPGMIPLRETFLRNRVSHAYRTTGVSV